jgi:hypothetical protein
MTRNTAHLSARLLVNVFNTQKAAKMTVAWVCRNESGLIRAVADASRRRSTTRCSSLNGSENPSSLDSCLAAQALARKPITAEEAVIIRSRRSMRSVSLTTGYP